MSTALSYSYAHAWDKMVKGVDGQGPYYQVSYYFTDWANSDQVANELMGYSSRVGDVTVRHPPHQHPLSTNLLCDDVQIEPVGRPTLNTVGLPSYTGGFLAHATYRSPPFNGYEAQDPEKQHQIDPTAAPILYCTQELDFDSEELLYEGRSYVWDSDATGNYNGSPLAGQSTHLPIKVPVGITTMTLTYHELPYMPMATVRSLRNKVNSATFLGVAAGKLLFLGAKSTREVNRNGDIAQRVTLVFKERDYDWRSFLQPNLIGFAKIKDGSGNYVFGSASFAPLALL
jgi:hypothetical protein